MRHISLNFRTQVHCIAAVQFLCVFVLSTLIYPRFVENYNSYIGILCSCYVAIILIRYCNYNYYQRNGEKYYSSNLGWANTISIIRGILICFLAGYLHCKDVFWEIGIIYALVTFLDIVDGFVARKTNTCTEYGSIIDMEFDALGMLVATILAIQMHKLPIFYIFVGLLRYLYVIHIFICKKCRQETFPLPPSDYRRFLAGLNMTFIFVALFPYFSMHDIYAISYVFAIPFYIIFIRDWLVVIGVIDPKSNFYLRSRSLGKILFFCIMPSYASLKILWLFLDYHNIYLLYLSFYVLFSLIAYKLNFYRRLNSFIIVMIYCLVLIFFYDTFICNNEMIILLSIFVVTIGSNIR